MYVCMCSGGTCREQHDGHRLVAAAGGADAERDEGHQEGEQDQGGPAQQEGHRGDLPVWDQREGEGKALDG